MKAWEKKIVPVSLAVSAVASLVIVLKSFIKGQPLNVVFLGVAVVTFALAIATWRKYRDGSGPASGGGSTE